jgi:hypothetical protein
LTGNRQDVEGHKPEPLCRDGLAGEDGAGNRREVLYRLTVAPADGYELSIERRSRRNVGEGSEEGSEASSQIGAMA